MKDDAVSPVIAFMLLLMVVVSFISVLNAYYIPSLKQQAEIQHVHSVEESFSKLSPDILQVLTFRQNISMKEPIQLGGGEVIFSPLKSSGYLEVNTSLQEKPLSSISISVFGELNPVQSSEINRSRIIYRPVGNFWVNQGYEWEDGVLNVSKGSRKTYLQYEDPAKVSAEKKNYYDMLLPRIHLEDYENNITSIRIDLINTENPGNWRSSSGNGAGFISIDLKESGTYTKTLDKGYDFKFNLPTDGELPGFNSVISTTFNQMGKKTNVEWDDGNYTLKIPDDLPCNVYPNLTIIRWNLSIHAE